MIHPREVIDIAQAAAEQFPDDARLAIENAILNIQALPNYPDYINGLIRTAISELVYAARQQNNSALKKEAGGYGGPAKVVVAGSSAVQTVMSNYYAYSIAGRTLGVLLGKELIPLAVAERNQAHSRIQNARILERLEKLVLPDQRVQDAVSNQRLAQIFRDVFKRETERVA